MSKNGVKRVPDGFHTITPHLVVKGAAAAIDFYKKAFGATELVRMPGPGGKLMHAEVKIGDSHLFLCDEFPEMGACSPAPGGKTPVTLNLYVEDCDHVFRQAVAAGATVQMPPADMFWGDRYAKVVDPFGHNWSLATHIEDVPPKEMARRGQKEMARMAAAQS